MSTFTAAVWGNFTVRAENEDTCAPQIQTCALKHPKIQLFKPNCEDYSCQGVLKSTLLGRTIHSSVHWYHADLVLPVWPPLLHCWHFFLCFTCLLSTSRKHGALTHYPHSLLRVCPAEGTSYNRCFVVSGSYFTALARQENLLVQEEEVVQTIQSIVDFLL